MTVQDLIDTLRKFDPKAKIGHSSDQEGNRLHSGFLVLNGGKELFLAPYGQTLNN